ncbi:MAG TPA: fumarylacetoacetate hydrolase family protein [Stellaceae bacterium]|nr:fumarylacetoacetate hydrolase family protein [Stellaceae bacterium]
MKLVVFGPDQRVGYRRDTQIVDVSAAFAKFLRERNGERYPYGEADRLAPPDLVRFIEAGPLALENAQKAVDYLFDQAQTKHGEGGEKLIHELKDVQIHAPLPKGARVACAGANFADHALAMAVKMQGNKPGPTVTEAQARAQQRTEGIRGFWKVGRDPVGPDGEVIYPSWSERFDYEGEIAIILGKKGKDIRAGDARRYIWGVTLLADWSIRRPLEPNKGSRFATSKNFDTGFSIGPCIAIGELDPFDAAVETFVNNERRQHYTTKGMVYDFAEYIEYLSTDFTFYPGDVISGGTAAGTAADSSPLLADRSYPPDRFLKPGDTVEIRSPVIGSLRARIVPKPAA